MVVVEIAAENQDGTEDVNRLEGDDCGDWGDCGADGQSRDAVRSMKCGMSVVGNAAAEADVDIDVAGGDDDGVVAGDGDGDQEAEGNAAISFGSWYWFVVGDDDMGKESGTVIGEQSYRMALRLNGVRMATSTREDWMVEGRLCACEICTLLRVVLMCGNVTTPRDSGKCNLENCKRPRSPHRNRSLS